MKLDKKTISLLIAAAIGLATQVGLIDPVVGPACPPAPAQVAP